MADTRIVLTRQLVTEPVWDSHREDVKNTKPALSQVEVKHGRRKSLAVLMDNIRSAWNAGSILRSADGFGFTHVYLCGITPTADNEAVTKTSLGAENFVPWSYHKDAVKLVNGLKKEGWRVFALEEDMRSVSISQFPNSQFSDHVVLIIGNEVTGVDPELLDLCHEIFYIPMRGEKKSFNVAIAFGIAAYALHVQKLER
jgi:tRNA G18 (ribose-2'-O)-methylase SpoU